MPIKIRNNIAVLEIVCKDGDRLSILPEEISGIEKTYSGYRAIKFYMRGSVKEYHSVLLDDGIIYETYVSDWMKALAYNKGLYIPDEEEGLMTLAPPELTKKKEET